MVETNPIINPVTGRQWDLNSLIEKLLEMQDALLQSQERNLTLSTQARELERVARDAEDFRAELANQGQLLGDKSRENKHLHQELSRMATALDARVQEIDDLKSVIQEMQHSLKTVQSERDLLSVMLTEAENQARHGRGGAQQANESVAQLTKEQQNTGWWRTLKGKQT